MIWDFDSLPGAWGRAKARACFRIPHISGILKLPDPSKQQYACNLVGSLIVCFRYAWVLEVLGIPKSPVRQLFGTSRCDRSGGLKLEAAQTGSGWETAACRGGRKYMDRGNYRSQVLLLPVCRPPMKSF